MHKLLLQKLCCLRWKKILFNITISYLRCLYNRKSLYSIYNRYINNELYTFFLFYNLLSSNYLIRKNYLYLTYFAQSLQSDKMIRTQLQVDNKIKITNISGHKIQNFEQINLINYSYPYLSFQYRAKHKREIASLQGYQ